MCYETSVVAAYDELPSAVDNVLPELTRSPAFDGIMRPWGETNQVKGIGIRVMIKSWWNGCADI